MESVLEFHLQCLARAEAEGHGESFELSPEECAELFEEGTLYYFRYLHLFQLERWPETVRDTGRNLRLFDFVHAHAAREEDQQRLEKWRPYILRMNAAAAAMLSLNRGDADQALTIIQRAVDRIAALDELDDETFVFERQRSQKALRELQAHIERSRPVPPLERLQQQLRTAIERQEFEQAAELRDRIRALRTAEQPG
jgi:hypothetical protein